MLRMSTQDCKNRGHGSSWARFKDKGSCAIGGTVLGQVISYDALVTLTHPPFSWITNLGVIKFFADHYPVRLPDAHASNRRF